MWFYHKTERGVSGLVKLCHGDGCLLRWISVRICSSLSRPVFVTASSGSPCMPPCSAHGFRRKGASCNSQRHFMLRCFWSDDKCLMNVERTGAWEERRRPVSGSVPLIACKDWRRSWRPQGDSRPSSRDLKPEHAEYETGLSTMLSEQRVHKEGFVTHQTVHFVDQ